MRERILEVAQRFFMQQGIRATTMDQIAEELSISKKTLYEHFPSKEALLESCSQNFIQQVEEKIQALRTQHARSAVLSVIATANYAYTLLASINPVLFTELRRMLPAVRSRLLEKIQQLVERQLRQVLAQGIAEGVFRKELPTDLLPLWVSYVMTQVVLNPDFARQTQKSVQEIYVETLLLLLYSFCTEEGRRQVELYQSHIRQGYAR
ncbi:MAG: TetR/AcrR family transcriptional regulator [Bacteroidia bacterium]|nr:TetR/AcrR family transcriptional regulator [Bacteroidia bacterium]MDW8236322.1 TetR/AcrR family transcriptional regulator [Bacteroidia bacterium]